jgi:hypothetical protein
MTEQNTNTDGPLADRADERDAIRDELDGTDLYVLRYSGNTNSVFLVERDRAPPTEYAIEDEPIVAIDWERGEDYALLIFRGGSTSGQSAWEIVEEMTDFVNTRTEAVETAAELLAEY